MILTISFSFMFSILFVNMILGTEEVLSIIVILLFEYFIVFIFPESSV